MPHLLRHCGVFAFPGKGRGDGRRGRREDRRMTPGALRPSTNAARNDRVESAQRSSGRRVPPLWAPEAYDFRPIFHRCGMICGRTGVLPGRSRSLSFRGEGARVNWAAQRGCLSACPRAELVEKTAAAGFFSRKVSASEVVLRANSADSRAPGVCPRDTAGGAPGRGSA